MQMDMLYIVCSIVNKILQTSSLNSLKTKLVGLFINILHFINNIIGSYILFLTYSNTKYKAICIHKSYDLIICMFTA